ncbi:hypothetical protein IV203_005831 [Nitzschia inconspicua]|uniref:Uncharacterized protein n=1 Tax=Nitzschia inconspicua TaxID=303405 RepID=A0A9K3KND9_9STRA|nr:hypothetical protein IV203_005831 [Nitzschia inconspicua]
MRAPAVNILLLFFCNIHCGRCFFPTPTWTATRTSIANSGIRPPLHPQSKQRDDIDEGEDPVDAFRAEQEAAQKVGKRLMMPRVILTSISQTITAFGWTFLIITFVLQALGYALVMDDSTGLRIDTLDAQKFQQEVTKSMQELTR